MRNIDDVRVAVVGLGYVGLPLAVEFGRKVPTVGFDIDLARVQALESGRDDTRELTSGEIRESEQLHFSSDVEAIRNCNVYIVTVPTPIDAYRRPNLEPLITASTTIGGVLAKNDVVIYESTVYPGATEEDCVPILEAHSGLRFNADFYVGYSPERINPGDRAHRLSTITKVTSGSTPECAAFVDDLYSLIIAAGTHPAPSIRIAEAAKVIENTQRDLNIALINELALIFSKLDIDTEEVLKAAGTKWNFLNFRPGLVGGHCIGVDPYYLTHKAQEIGYHPEVILAGRRINDGMGKHIAERVVKLMTQHSIELVGARVLVMGLAFKENCSDIRNTKVIDVVSGLRQYEVAVDVFDPWVDTNVACAEYNINLVEDPEYGTYDAILLAVAHDVFRTMGADLARYGKEDCVIFDVKHALPRDLATARL